MAPIDELEAVNLWEGAGEGDRQAVKQILASKKYTVFSVDVNGYSAWMAALSWGQLEMYKTLEDELKTLIEGPGSEDLLNAALLTEEQMVMRLCQGKGGSGDKQDAYDGAEDEEKKFIIPGKTCPQGDDPNFQAVEVVAENEDGELVSARVDGGGIFSTGAPAGPPGPAAAAGTVPDSKDQDGNVHMEAVVAEINESESNGAGKGTTNADDANKLLTTSRTNGSNGSPTTASSSPELSKSDAPSPSSSSSSASSIRQLSCSSVPAVGDSALMTPGQLGYDEELVLDSPTTSSRAAGGEKKPDEAEKHTGSCEASSKGNATASKGEEEVEEGGASSAGSTHKKDDTENKNNEEEHDDMELHEDHDQDDGFDLVYFGDEPVKPHVGPNAAFLNVLPEEFKDRYFGILNLLRQLREAQKKKTLNMEVAMKAVLSMGDTEGDTAYHHFACSCSDVPKEQTKREIMQKFEKHEVSPYARNRDGSTAFDMVATHDWESAEWFYTYHGSEPPKEQPQDSEYDLSDEDYYASDDPDMDGLDNHNIELN